MLVYFYAIIFNFIYWVMNLVWYHTLSFPGLWIEAPENINEFARKVVLRTLPIKAALWCLVASVILPSTFFFWPHGDDVQEELSGPWRISEWGQQGLRSLCLTLHCSCCLPHHHWAHSHHHSGCKTENTVWAGNSTNTRLSSWVIPGTVTISTCKMQFHFFSYNTKGEE